MGFIPIQKPNCSPVICIRARRFIEMESGHVVLLALRQKGR